MNLFPTQHLTPSGIQVVIYDDQGEGQNARLIGRLIVDSEAEADEVCALFKAQAA